MAILLIFGLVWFGMVWFGLVLYGVVWYVDIVQLYYHAKFLASSLEID